MRVRRVLIALGFGLAAGAGVFLIGGVPETGTEAFWRKLCDALTVPGVLLTGMGLLSLASAHGAFDGLSFPVRKAFGQILSEEKRNAMPKTYYDYVEARRAGSRGKNRGILWTGLGFLAGAGICLAIWLSRFS